MPGCWQLPGSAVPQVLPAGCGQEGVCSRRQGAAVLVEQRGLLWLGVQGGCLVGFSQLGCVVPLVEHSCVRPNAILLSSCCPSVGKELYPGPCLPPAGLSAGRPGAMRCSPKRSLTAVIAASFLLLLLLLLLHRGSWQDPQEVSPVPVEPPPPRPMWAPHPRSAPFLPQWDPNLWFCCLPCPISSPNSSSAFSLPFGLLQFRSWRGKCPPLAYMCPRPRVLTSPPVAAIQVQFRDLPSDAVLKILKQGSLHILQDTDNLCALHNISYHLLAGSPLPHKSKCLWGPVLGWALGAAPLTRCEPPHHCHCWVLNSLLFSVQLGSGVTTAILDFPGQDPSAWGWFSCLPSGELDLLTLDVGP